MGYSENSGIEYSRRDLFEPFPARTVQATEEPTLGGWLAGLWEGRHLILGGLLLFLALGLLRVWMTPPVYPVEALLQIQGKRSREFNRLGSLFSESADAQAEIEILKSNLLLGRTVEARDLDLVAEPHGLTLPGQAAPAISIQTFTVPAAFRDLKFQVTTLADGRFTWATRAGHVLATGRPGELLGATYVGVPLRLRVRSFSGAPGQRFDLQRKPMAAAIALLRRDFNAFERGKATNVIGLTYRHPSPILGAAILDEIVAQYVRHKAEKRNAEASRTLAILQERLPLQKARLDAAEARLNQFRSSGPADPAREAETLAARSAAIRETLSGLLQKRQELLRTYRPHADVVTTVNAQVRRLRGELGQLDARARTLPGAQQTVLRLSREVAVNQELYSALLNNIQELQLARAGDVGSYGLVDRASAAMEPLGPSPATQVAMFACLGLLAGAGLARLKRILWNGVKDPRLIEARLGLPVLATVPHSEAQARHAKAMIKQREGLHLLALGEPDELATESLRSLRTALRFAMKDAADQVVVITGPSPFIGKSFISCNFAALLAQSGLRVLLVDGDLRKGNLHHYFGLQDRRCGFGDVLTRRAALASAIQPTGIAGLDLLSTGPLPPNPSELLMSESFRKCLELAKATYPYVIIDAPPVLAVTDATLIGSRAGAVLLVAKYGRHRIDELLTCQKVLEGAGVRLLGCVFNEVQPAAAAGASLYQYAYPYSTKA